MYARTELSRILDRSVRLVYVADSAAVTKGIRFISRLPAMFAQEQEVKDRAWSDGGWIDVGVMTENPKRDSAFYKHKEYIVDIAAQTAVRPYRLIVVHSSSLDKRKAKTPEKNLLGQREELEARLEQLSKVEFACEPDARAALERSEARIATPFTRSPGTSRLRKRSSKGAGRVGQGKTNPFPPRPSSGREDRRAISRSRNMQN